MTTPAPATITTSPHPSPADDGSPQFSVSLAVGGEVLLEVFPFTAQDAHTWTSGARAALEATGHAVTTADAP